MKKLNLIKRLWTDSHEKQKMGGMRRYAAMLIMLLTLGVGQMWATYYWSAAGSDNNGNSWGATAMTLSTDGYYWYYHITCTKPGGDGGFKIRASNENWDTSYGYGNVSTEFNGTNISDSWNNNDGNAHFYDGGGNYYIIFYPVNGINTTSNPIICASTTLPDNSHTWKFTTVANGEIGTFSGTGDGPYTLDVTYNSASMDWRASRFQLDGSTNYICDNYTIGTSSTLALRTGDQTNIASPVNGSTYRFTITYENPTWNVQIEETAAPCTTPTIAWSTAPEDGVAGGSMTASVTTNQTSPTITWNSSNTSAATVNSSGVISYVAAGSTKITAKYTGSGDYCSQEVSVSKDITVSAADAWAFYQDGSKTCDFTNVSGTYTTGIVNINAAYAISGQGGTQTKTLYYYLNGETQKTTGAFSLLTGAGDPTVALDGSGAMYWQDAPGKYKITIKKVSSAWKIKAERAYTVTFSKNGMDGASATAPEDVVSGGKVTEPSDPTLTGYDFGGWYEEEGCANEWNFSTGTISDNKTLFAKWTPHNYSLSYSNSNVTSDPASGSTFAYGSTGDKMTITPKSGYKITNIEASNAAISASADGNATGSWTVTGTMPAANVTLTVTTASVPEIRLLGRFKIYNSTRTSYSTISGNDWTTDYAQSTMAMTYNHLTGYYDLATYRSAAELKADGNLYFYLHNGTIKYGSSSSNLVPGSSYPGSANALYNNGSNFYMDSSSDLLFVVLHFDATNLKLWFTGTEDTEYSTTFSAGEYGSISADGNAISANSSASVDIGFERTLTATPASGYGFERWITTGGVSVADAFSASTTVSATSAGGTVTAKWYTKVDSKFYVIGDFAGGAWTDVETHPLDRYYPGESTVYYRTVTVDAVDKYFRFFKKESSNHAYGSSSNNLLVTKGIENKVDAYRDNGNNFKYSAGGTVWVVLDATNNKCWIQDPDEKTYYTVTFGKGTGGSDISAEDGESHSLTSGVAYEEGISITFTQTAASGYSFKEWNTRSDGSGEQLGTDAEGYTITSLDADVSVYAIYNETLYTCTVSCDANYGSASMSGSVSLGATPRAISVTAKEWCNFDSWVTTGGVSVADAYDPSTTVTASNTGTLTATFNTNKIIYFDNSASNWNDENGIWVYLFSSTYGVWYDDEVNGGVHPGVNRLEYGRMTRIGTSKIYYYKYSTNTTIAGVAFTKADQHDYTAFNGTSAAWLTSFNTCQPCYIASYVYTSKNGVGYHSTGYWKKYGTYDSGFSLWIYYNGLYHENKFTTTDPTSFVYTTSDELTSAGSAYNYHVTRCAGSNLRRKDYNGAIAASDSDYPRELIDNASDGTITTSSAGEYNFTLDLSGDHIYMYTEYPLTVGDYRVVLNNGTKDHPSGRIVRARSESVSDTVSFFINKDATNALHVDTCKSTYPSVVWETIKDVSASGLSLNRGPYKSTTGVYNFTITHSRYKDVRLDSITDEKKVYTGNYYIRTDAADGQWKTYMTTPDNKMQHSAKSLNTEAQFDYYFTKYVLHDGNLQFTIANDYSPCISDTLYGDTYTGGADKSHQTLLADANVRYMWNSGTNVISRAYLDPATTEGSHFIELHSSDGKLFSSSATDDTHGAPLTSIVFTDTKNWIYQADVKALPNAVATLTAEYNDNNIDIISEGSEQKLIGGDDTDNETLYPLRMVYDFKTNILISAWIAESDQTLGTTNLALDADLMIVRKLQEPAAQITFTTGSLSDVKTIYGALRFDYDDMVGELSSWDFNYGKLIYDVSFPFDVNVKDIFGVGNMDDHWVVQKYNGARRAKEGWFMESKPFWETLTEDSVMHAYEGYTVIIDRPSFNNSESVVWKNKEEGSSVYLYFPSASVDPKTISRGSVTLHLDSLNCKKDQWFTDPKTSQRLNHKFTDSNWRMLGVPLLSNDRGDFSSLFKSLLDYTDENPFGYLYTWSTVDNSYSITSTSDFTFKAMHSYMVQFAGDVTFTGSYVHAPSPSSIVAAKRTEGERHYTVKLQMANANIDDVTSQTYVELRENACDTFALNEDVYMVRSSNIADLYTFAGAYDVAANVLSVGNHVVPVGMDVKQAGMYTFSMPSDFSGTVTLVDTQAGTRTNLSLNSYEIYLNRGAINDRFYLDIDIQEVITSVENVEGSNAINDGGAHKFLQNGQMYILKNGVIYDAKGNRVK